MLAMLAFAVLAPHGNHAVLISYAGAGDDSPVNDCKVMTEALIRSGWGRNEISYYDGHRENGSLAFLQKEIADARDGHLLVYVSGKATLEPKTLTAGMESYWNWNRLSETLSKGGPITLVADTGFSNLSFGRTPRNVRSLVVDATWRDVTQTRRTTTVLHNGARMDVGILTYVIAREWPFSQSLVDLAYRVNKIKDSGSMAAMWAETPRVRAQGTGVSEPLG